MTKIQQARLKFKIKVLETKLDKVLAEYGRLRSGLVELACAIKKSEPNMQSRTHLRCFRELMGDK